MDRSLAAYPSEHAPGTYSSEVSFLPNLNRLRISPHLQITDLVQIAPHTLRFPLTTPERVNLTQTVNEACTATPEVPMIDFYDAEFSFPLDPQVYRDLPGHKSPKPPKRRLKRKVEAPSWMGTAEVIFTPDSFRIRTCPQKLLGSWNSWGKDDLREYVSLTAPLVLQELGHRLTDDQEALMAAGAYRIQEVHVAQAFHLVNYSQQEFIRRLFYAIAESHRPEWANRGTGFYIKGLNRRVSAYLYAKDQEFAARA
jgi:hypothetical protein